MSGPVPVPAPAVVVARFPKVSAALTEAGEAFMKVWTVVTTFVPVPPIF